MVYGNDNGNDWLLCGFAQRCDPANRRGSRSRISILTNKIHEVERLILSYEDELRKAQQDLVILKSAFAIFQLEGDKPIKFAGGVGLCDLL